MQNCKHYAENATICITRLFSEFPSAYTIMPTSHSDSNKVCSACRSLLAIRFPTSMSMYTAINRAYQNNAPNSEMNAFPTASIKIHSRPKFPTLSTMHPRLAPSPAPNNRNTPSTGPQARPNRRPAQAASLPRPPPITAPTSCYSCSSRLTSLLMFPPTVLLPLYL